MAKLKGKASHSKKRATPTSKKRAASTAFPAENGRDEFFEGSDSDQPSEGEEQEQQAETAAEKRLRLGMLHSLSGLLAPHDVHPRWLKLVLHMQPRNTCTA